MGDVTQDRVQVILLHPELQTFVWDKVDPPETKREAKAHRRAPGLPRVQSYGQAEHDDAKVEGFFDPATTGRLVKRIRAKLSDFSDFGMIINYLDENGIIDPGATETFVHCGITGIKGPDGDANGSDEGKLELTIAVGDTA